MRSVVAVFLYCLLLAACARRPTPTPQRLPTRAPSPAPTATPFAASAIDYYQQGVERQQAGDSEGALQYLTWAIQRDPGLVRAYVARSSVYLARGDLNQALTDADAAVEIAPSARSYSLRGEALRMMGRYEQALDAFDKALESDSGLATETFQSRWAAARAVGDTERIVALSEEYAAARSDDPLRHYYYAWADLELGMHREAISVLVEGIGESGHPPALLWYVLGQAYSEIEAWPEAAASIEAARALVEAGDNSMGLHADRPVVHLFAALGQAYLGIGRCADAETMLTHAMSIGAPASEYLPLLQKAQVCQTPTANASP
jgi:tetratricopeptide (TPR) repeat protein